MPSCGPKRPNRDPDAILKRIPGYSRILSIASRKIELFCLYNIMMTKYMMIHPVGLGSTGTRPEIPKAFSRTRAAHSSSDSLPGGATSCSPKGSPSRVNPQGTLMDGLKRGESARESVSQGGRVLTNWSRTARRWASASRCTTGAPSPRTLSATWSSRQRGGPLYTGSTGCPRCWRRSPRC